MRLTILADMYSGAGGSDFWVSGLPGIISVSPAPMTIPEMSINTLKIIGFKAGVVEDCSDFSSDWFIVPPMKHKSLFR